MLKRGFRTQQSLACHWAEQAVALCAVIDDETLNDYITPVHDSVSALARDRRVIVIGGDSCGKSSLLAGIAGIPLIARVPLTQHYVCWRYRSTDGDTTCSRFYPSESLSGLELVDTRSCAAPEVADTVSRLLTGADIVLAVVDARSPETSPVWDILAAVPEHSVGERLLAVTFTDTLAADAALRLKESLRELCRNRLGDVLPLYFVCPNSEQGMSVFVDRVHEAVASAAGSRMAIHRVLERSLELVQKQGSILNTRASVARTDSGFLAGIEQEIDNFRSHQMLGRARLTEAYVGAVSGVVPRVQVAVRKALGFFLSPVVLMRLELMGTGTEKLFYALLRDDVLQQQRQADEQFVLSCAGHWKSVRPRMKKTLECEIGDFPAEKLASELAGLRECLGSEMYAPIVQSRLRSKLSALYTARIGWMRACIGFICLFLCVAGILGIIGQDIPAVCCVAATLPVWLGASVAHLVSSRRIRREIRYLSRGLERGIRESLDMSVEKLLISRVAAYRSLYTEPRVKVARHAETLEPLQKSHYELLKQLRTLRTRIPSI